MQVKKFEAPTMKEAIKMIKNQLGPEAIILSAKDINKGFGLAGRRSVEVTAAVSETMLRKKQMAERKLNEQNKNRYQQIPAAQQKEFIDKVFQKIQVERKPPAVFTSTPYIDIIDSEDSSNSFDNMAHERIKSAAKAASQAAVFIEDPPKMKVSKVVKEERNSRDLEKILSMQAEINKLRALISQFQKVPQTFVNMHPGASEGISYELSASYEKLKKAGIDEEQIVKILKLAQRSLNSDQIKKTAYVDAWVAKYILENVQIVTDSETTKYHAFVGPSGHGKTSCLVKLASHLVICKNKSVAIVTCDTHKVGAHEQLRIYAKILNVPFVVIKKPEEWARVELALKNVDHVLIDYPGMGLRSDIEQNYLLSMLPPESNSGRAIHYVLSAMTKTKDAYEVLNRYGAVGPTDIIFTSLDESSQHGIIFTLQQKFQLPLHSFGIGPKIPEDFEAATKERVVDLIFKLTKLKERGLR
ncbi:MAG: flagellar biosynthesis protein FlhF [Bdellovibrionaceae bacterium]|nr:flagellar biosynthesis protein FlhF [Pseudobdellovibrionaceae bacterium]